MKIYETAKISERTDLSKCHPNSFIGDFSFVSCNELELSEGAHVNRFVEIQGRGRVKVGKYSVIGSHCSIVTSTDTPTAHMSDLADENVRDIRTADVIIGDYCYIGPHTTIMPGVIVEDGAVVGAYAYITRKVKSWQLIHPIQTLESRKRMTRSNMVLMEEEIL